MELSTKLKIDESVYKATNLVDRFSKEDLAKIGLEIWDGYNRDELTRVEWKRRMQAAMNLALQVSKEKNFPWPNAANVIFPLVTIAALQFSARAYSNTITGTDVVRYRVVGEDTSGQLAARAERIGRHMSWQVLEEDEAWEEQHDRLLINLGIVGTAFKKSYFSPSLGHNVSELILAQDLVMDYFAKSVESCSRKTQIIRLYRNEMHERCMSGIFDKSILNEPWFEKSAVIPVSTDQAGKDQRTGMSVPQSDSATPFTVYEQHCYFDFDGDGYAEPYIITIEHSSKAVLRIVARFDTENDIKRDDNDRIISIRATEYYTKYSFIPSPDGGIYDIGFGILLGPINEAVNTGINQLLDSGTMQNSIGGFLGKGAKIRGGQYTMAPWEWKRVDSTGDDLRKNMVPFPERQPSVVMYQLLGLLINYSDRVAGTTDTMVGVSPGQNTPAETTRTVTEQGMQIFSVIFKRVWRSMKEEFKKLHALNAVYLPTKVQFGTSAKNVIRREDYAGNPNYVCPVADPNITSQAARVQQAVMIRQGAGMVSGYDTAAVERSYLKALRVENIDEIYPGPDKVPPIPNPKMQVEEMKLKGKAMTLEHQKQTFLIDLLSKREKTTAEILKLHAESAAIVASIGAEKAKTVLAAFDSAVAALSEYNQMINDQVSQLTEGGDNGNSSDGGGVPGVDGTPSDKGVPAIPGGMAGGSEGAMGSENVSAGVDGGVGAG